MRTLYPSPDDYRLIYARYYQGRSAEELCSHLGKVKGLSCLDLCAGEGQATDYFIHQGASQVWSVDESTSMAKAIKKRCPQAQMKCQSVEAALSSALQVGKKFDRVVCRQGVNYWLTAKAVQLLFECMKAGSIFVFNTLNNKPSAEPRARTYVQDGRSYAEVAYSEGDTIHTVVACEGFEPHQSEILWLSRELLHEILEPHYRVVEHVNGNSSVYVCTRYRREG